MASATAPPLPSTRRSSSSQCFLLPPHPTHQHLHLRRLTSSVAFTHNPKPYRRRPDSPKATQSNPPLPVRHHHHQTHLPTHPTKVLQSFAGSTTRQLHARVLKLGLAPSKPMLSEKLAILYEKAPLQKSALKVLDEMPGRNLVAIYASVVGILAQLGSWYDLLDVFMLMMEESVHPDKFLLPKILKASAEIGDLRLAAAVHGYMIKNMNLDIDIVLGNSLINMYAICGDLESSKVVLAKMPQRDVVSWTALVAGYSNNGMMDEAVGMFKSMEEDGIVPDIIAWNALISGYARNGNVGVALFYLEKMRKRKNPAVSTFNGLLSGCVQSGLFEDALDAFFHMLPEEAPNAITVASAISACSSLRELSLGQQLHAYALKCDFTSNAFVCGSAIDMYLNCDVGKNAEKVFVKTENKTAAIWNEMIAGYADAGRMEEALNLIDSMERDGLKPDVITYNSILTSFARCGQKEEALKTLHEILRVGLRPNIVSMNALIGGFQQCGLSKEALKLFRILQSPWDCISSDDNHEIDCFPVELLNEVYLPNATTLVSALAACAVLKSKRAGEEIHAYALRNHFDHNIFVSSALVDMYTKCNDIDIATEVFYCMDEKNTVSWNSLIAGYNLKGMPEVALSLFIDMLEGGTDPSFITLVIVLSACSNAHALNLGRGLHGFAIKLHGSLPATLQSSLVGMYAKCSSLPEARLVFNCASEKELGLWNAIISGYTLYGLAEDSILLFKKMTESGIKPNHITFTAVISACNQEELVAEGWNYFHLMKDIHGITPTLEYFTCIVGILSYADSLEEAANLIRRMAFEPDAFPWATLRSCNLDINSEIGEMTARELSELKSWNASMCYYMTFVPWLSCGMLLRVLETHFNLVD